jgi:hypothetical protein
MKLAAVPERLPARAEFAVSVFSSAKADLVDRI